MTDYIQAARDALAAQRDHERIENELEESENQRKLQEYSASFGPTYSAALAATLGADPASPDFTKLVWSVETRSDTGAVYLATTFQGVRIFAAHAPGSFTPLRPEFEVAQFGTKVASFSDLAEFGRAIEELDRLMNIKPLPSAYETADDW